MPDNRKEQSGGHGPGKPPGAFREMLPNPCDEYYLQSHQDALGAPSELDIFHQIEIGPPSRPKFRHRYYGPEVHDKRNLEPGIPDIEGQPSQGKEHVGEAKLIKVAIHGISGDELKRLGDPSIHIHISHRGLLQVHQKIWDSKNSTAIQTPTFR